jgi:uncharacterized membrane protein YeiB
MLIVKLFWLFAIAVIMSPVWMMMFGAGCIEWALKKLR